MWVKRNRHLDKSILSESEVSYEHWKGQPGPAFPANNRRSSSSAWVKKTNVWRLWSYPIFDVNQPLGYNPSFRPRQSVCLLVMNTRDGWSNTAAWYRAWDVKEIAGTTRRWSDSSEA